MRPATAQHTPPAECPRCAYDLSGTVARWTASCDLHGTCPECGLAFDWCDVMDPARTMPRWFYEAPARSPWLSFARTFFRLVRPRRFWGRINLACPIHVRRLVLLVVAMILSTHVLIGAASGLARFTQMNEQRRWITRGGGTLTTASPIAFYAPVVLWPYAAHQSGATYTYPTPGAGRMTPPAVAKYSVVFSSARAGGPELASPVLALVLMPLTYLLLGDTLRRTRVRPLHLLRVFAYTTTLLPVALTAYIASWPVWRDVPLPTWGVLPILHSSFFAALDWLDDIMPIHHVLLLTVVASLSLWWHAATTRYLRLPHAIGIVAAMITITLLVLAIYISYTTGWSDYGRF